VLKTNLKASRPRHATKTVPATIRSIAVLDATGEPVAVRFEVSLGIRSPIGFIAEGYLVLRH